MEMSFSEKLKYNIHRACYGVSHPLFVYKFSRRFSDSFSQADLEYCVTHRYEFSMNRKLDLNNVNTFNEKLNWLKCFYHDERMTECADKVTAPAYFMKQTGLDESYIVRNLGIYDRAEDINFEALPERFVLKSNWGSGRQIIVKDKNTADFDKIKSEVATWMDIKTNHYYHGFEYGYKNIVPKIVCEEFIDFEYKMEFFCFNGKPIYFWTIYNDKTADVCANFYDADTFDKLDIKQGYPNSLNELEIPEEYEKMKEIAKNLSAGFPFMRVDFFKARTGFKFSEMTFYHWAGATPFEPESFDLEFGKNLVLPEKKI